MKLLEIIMIILNWFMGQRNSKETVIAEHDSLMCFLVSIINESFTAN